MVYHRMFDESGWKYGETFYSLEEWIENFNATARRTRDGIVWICPTSGQQRRYDHPSQLEQEIMLANYEKSKRKALGKKKG